MRALSLAEFVVAVPVVTLVLWHVGFLYIHWEEIRQCVVVLSR